MYVIEKYVLRVRWSWLWEKYVKNEKSDKTINLKLQTHLRNFVPRALKGKPLDRGWRPTYKLVIGESQHWPEYGAQALLRAPPVRPFHT